MQLQTDVLAPIKIGLFLCFLTILFGVGMGIGFGIAEDTFKDWLNAGVAAHPNLHDEASSGKIWRYVQRAHFHATGIGAFTLGLVILVALCDMRARFKMIASTLIGLGGLYSLSWFAMFLLSPSMGRDAAHHAFATEVLTYVGVGCLLLGMALLAANLFLGVGRTDRA